MKKLILLLILCGCEKQWKCPDETVLARAAWVQQCVKDSHWTPNQVDDCVQASYKLFCRLDRQ